MNYEEYISGQTSAQVRPHEAEWNNYMNQYGSPVQPDKTYAQNNARKVKASSYIEMGPEVYVRPTHEAQLTQQIDTMQQRSIENRLVDQMREYNQSYINQMEALKKQTAPVTPKKVELTDEKSVAVKKEKIDEQQNKKAYVKPETVIEQAPVNVKLFDDEEDEQDFQDVQEKPVDLSNFKPYDSLYNHLDVDDLESDTEENSQEKQENIEPEEPEIPGISFTDAEDDDSSEIAPEIDDELLSLDPPEMEFIEAPVEEKLVDDINLEPAGLQLTDVTSDEQNADNIVTEEQKEEKKKPGRKPGSTKKITDSKKKDSYYKTSKKAADTKKKASTDKKKTSKK